MNQPIEIRIIENIQFTIHGTGTDTWVWIHGYGFDNSIWDDLYAIIEGRHILVNLPGHDKAPLFGIYTMEALAKKVVQGLQDLEVVNPVLVGHSMGGYLAVHIIGYMQTRGLALVHSHPFADLRETREKRLRTMGLIEKNGVKPFVQPMIRSLFGDPEKYELLVEKYCRRASQLSPEALIYGQLAMADRSGKEAILEAYNHPVLFIIGKKDIAVPPEYRYKQTSLPEISQVWQGNIGHMGMFEAAAELRRAIQEFATFCKSMGI